MLLYFHQKLEALRLTPHEFFHIAHVALFNRDAQLEDDYAQFLLHGVLPKYCITYLKRMQEREMLEMRQDGTPDADGAVREAADRQGSSTTQQVLDYGHMPKGEA